METLDPSTLADASPNVSFKRQTETVTLPTGVVSVAGITVVTGGVELSCGSCMLAFGFWGGLIGLSCLAVGLWDLMNQSAGGTSHLLNLGLVILGVSFAMVVGVVIIKKRLNNREGREDGKQVLVDGQGVIKKVTV